MQSSADWTPISIFPVSCLILLTGWASGAQTWCCGHSVWTGWCSQRIVRTADACSLRKFTVHTLRSWVAWTLPGKRQNGSANTTRWKWPVSSGLHEQKKTPAVRLAFWHIRLNPRRRWLRPRLRQGRGNSAAGKPAGTPQWRQSPEPASGCGPS